MTTDTTNENTEPENTESENTQPEEGARASSESREPTPRTWLRRIARRKRMLAHERWRQLDDVAREGISDDDYATTMATLETMARNLGWDESGENHGHPGHRRARGGHGHGRRHHGMRHGRCAERATVEA